MTALSIIGMSSTVIFLGLLAYSVITKKGTELIWISCLAVSLFVGVSGMYGGQLYDKLTSSKIFSNKESNAERNIQSPNISPPIVSKFNKSDTASPSPSYTPTPIPTPTKTFRGSAKGYGDDSSPYIPPTPIIYKTKFENEYYQAYRNKTFHMSIHEISYIKNMKGGPFKDKVLGNFLVVGIYVWNISSESARICYDDFKLVDPYGNRFSASRDAAFEISYTMRKENFNYLTLNPTMSKYGFIPFDIKNPNISYNLRYVDDITNDDLFFPLKIEKTNPD